MGKSQKDSTVEGGGGRKVANPTKEISRIAELRSISVGEHSSDINFIY